MRKMRKSIAAADMSTTTMPKKKVVVANMNITTKRRNAIADITTTPRSAVAVVVADWQDISCSFP